MSLKQPNVTELKNLVQWVRLTDDVRELSIKYGDVELFVSKDGRAPSPTATTTAPIPSPMPIEVPAPPAEAAAPVAPAAPVASGAQAPTPANTAVSAVSLADNESIVSSPMVGTFYAAPKPGAGPFVKVGDAVTASSIVGIVEVMKLMNNLEAKVEGTVSRILVEDEQAVEYGQPLMVITRNV